MKGSRKLFSESLSSWLFLRGVVFKFHLGKFAVMWFVIFGFANCLNPLLQFFLNGIKLEVLCFHKLPVFCGQVITRRHSRVDIYKITIFIIQVRHDEGKIFDMLLEACHQGFPGIYFHFTIALVLHDVKLCQFAVSVSLY